MCKILTKVSSLALAAAVVSSGFSVNASAAEVETLVLETNEVKNVLIYETQENVGVNDVGPGLGNDLIVPYGTSKPTDTWNLSKKGSYSFGGSLNTARSLYTDYLLTGKSKVKVEVSNNDHQYSLKFKLKRKDAIIDNQIGPTYEVPLGKTGYVEYELDKSSNYYLEFIGPCNFSGSIK